MSVVRYADPAYAFGADCAACGAMIRLSHRAEEQTGTATSHPDAPWKLNRGSRIPRAPDCANSRGVRRHRDQEETRASEKADTGSTDRSRPSAWKTTVIALPLLQKIEQDGLSAPQDVIIDINLEYPGGRDVAKTWTLNKIRVDHRKRRVRDEEQGEERTEPAVPRRLAYRQADLGLAPRGQR